MKPRRFCPGAAEDKKQFPFECPACDQILSLRIRFSTILREPTFLSSVLQEDLLVCEFLSSCFELRSGI
jgi:hypothetical protein